MTLREEFVLLSFLLSIADESDHDKIVYIYEQFHDVMIRYAKRKLYMARAFDYANRAEDVVQNAFVRMIKYIHAIDFSVSERELRNYILSVVSNEVIRELKDEEHHANIDDFINVASEESFVNDLLIHERYTEVVAAIEQLGEKYRLALVYRFCKGYSIKEIAELLGIPEKTVYTRVERGQKMLKAMLNKEDEV